MFRCNRHHQGDYYSSLLKLLLYGTTVRIIESQQARLCASYKNTKLKLLKTTVNSASSNNTLPDDDGDETETCRSCFNVNFNITFKAILLCISW